MIARYYAVMRQYPAWSALFAALILFVPWLGIAWFNTKGEPREAIVAVSMLAQGDWILPVSLGGDIPYKPPMLAWLVAVCSWLFNGGVVSEWTSRLPSAIAAALMAWGVARWLVRNGWSRCALPASLVLMTCVEVWRNASLCRVDMLLAASFSLACLSLYRWFVERDCSVFPWAAVVWMAVGALDKGPVAVVLPCAVMFIYGLLFGRLKVGSVIILAISAVFALIPLGVWYVLAFFHASDPVAFMSLVWEENFGRMTGTMSYDSHINPWYYNIWTLLAGLLPYTPLLLCAPWLLRGRKLWSSPLLRWCAVWAVTVFVFFCIPSSKRSTYLLPMYMPMAVMTATCAWRCVRVCPRGLRIGAIVLTGICTTALAGCAVAGFTELAPIGYIGCSACIVAAIVAAVGIRTAWRAAALRGWHAALWTVWLTMLTAGAAVVPPILNAKSDRPLAETIESIAQDGPVYQYIDDPLLRYYTVNYYTGDRVRRLPLLSTDVKPGSLLLMDPSLLVEWRAAMEGTFTIEPYQGVYPVRSCDTRRPVALWIISPVK